MRQALTFLLLLVSLAATPARAVTLTRGDFLAIASGDPMMDPNVQSLYHYDTEKGSLSPVTALPVQGSQLVVESAESALYATNDASGTSTIRRISLVTGEVTPVSMHPGIASFIPGLRSFAVTPDGRILAVEATGIVEVDPVTGAPTPRVLGELFFSIDVDPRGTVFVEVALDPGDTLVDIATVDLSDGTYSPLGDHLEGGLLRVDAAGNRFVHIFLASAGGEPTLRRTAGSPHGLRFYYNHEDSGGVSRWFDLDENGDVVAGGGGFADDPSGLLADLSRYDAETGDQTPIADLPGNRGVVSVAVYLPEPARALLVAFGAAVMALARWRRM